MKTYTHPTLTEVAGKLEDKSIDVAAIWATGFHCEYRHYVITDDGERVLISDRDHDLINLYDESLRAAYRELGLLLTPAKLARKREEIWAKLADSKPAISDADAARIRAEWDRINAVLAEVILRRA